jgi:acyl-CoA synthetase (NDP forming)
MTSRLQPGDDTAPAGRPALSALHALLAPRSIAVVGAGRRHGGVGHETVRALRDYGFRGRLFAVNRSGRPPCGVATYRSLAELPAPADLVVLAIPAGEAMLPLATAARHGTRAAVLLGPGWDPADPRAAQRHTAVLRMARAHRMRLLGPASLGVLNADPRVRLNASLAPVRPPAGGLAVAVGSGGLGVALLQSAVDDHLGISSFVSVGEQTDITTGQLLDHWRDDPATRCVVLAHDARGDQDDFVCRARAFARRKPIVAVTTSWDDRVGDGVIHTTGVADALATARMLAGQPPPAGNRLAVVGNAGDLTELAAGTARHWGFAVVPLSGSTRAQLPYAAGSRRCDNPVDLGLGASPERIADAVETVAHSDEADILLLMLAGTRANVPAAITAALAPVLDGHPGLTVAAVLTGHTDDVHRLGTRGVPVFREPEQAVRALSRALSYARWRRQPAGRQPEAATLIGSRA